MEGWAVGLFGTVLHTVNGGKTWKPSKLSRQLSKLDESENIWLDAVYFVSSDIGWVVGINGRIFHTDDGGKTWVRQESYTQNFLDDVFFISETEGWSVGKEGLSPPYKRWRTKLATSAYRYPNGSESYLHK